MKVQKVADYASDLPEKDDHPYRSGAWRPQHTEYDAWDLDVIGEIPDDLTGTYLRNTETAVFQPIKRYHPFEGDAMIHSITFGGGEARYANRFVKTEGFLAEQQAGRALWAGIAEHPSNAIAEHGWGARGMLKDAASTDVIVHRGEALASYYQCGELYRLDPVTLEDRSVSKWGIEYSGRGVAAHPKVDPHTGELLFFNYLRDDLNLGYGVIDADGEIIFTQGEPETRQVVDAGSVWLLDSIMMDCQARWIIWGCGTSNTDLRLDSFMSDGQLIPTGVKTGTQQGPLNPNDTSVC